MTPFSLNEMDPNSFEHMANALAIKVLGSGVTTFGPGSDGGRDGWFQGEANYPSPADRWTGEWYIQAKFHSPNLTKDHNKWLISKVKEEIAAFEAPASPRQWPDNWIIVTNVNFSAVPRSGAFDTIRNLVRKANPALVDRFSIWGGDKVVELLSTHKDVSSRYGAFITPGNVLAALHDELADSKASIRDIIRYLVVTQFNDQQFTKLEQAGSGSDNRPGIQKLFRDIPFLSPELGSVRMAGRTLAKALAENHTIELTNDNQEWRDWQRNPERSRIWFVKGGPGQGKSTITQYFCQIQRAALILGDSGTRVPAKLRPVLSEVREVASNDGLWPKLPRIPVALELKEYAKWLARQVGTPVTVLSYLAARIEEATGQKALAGTLKRAFSASRWLFVFDGMDEVPGDVKDVIAGEINYFVDDLLVGCDSDAHIICTSRPQGYSGQFDDLDAANVRLTKLNPEQALECAKPILQIDRSPQDGARFYSILADALATPAIREIMTTPLQAHIMAVVVRDGGTPPERKWELFSNFYKVINKREADKSADKKLSALLKGHGKLIKSLHNRLGFELHAQAELSKGAQASLDRDKLLILIQELVVSFQKEGSLETIETLREATTDRLVLVNTPENGESVRFDIRPLQEFFAAEYIYESASYETLPDRVRAIASDSHWREVLHFLLSALVENERRIELAQVIQVLAQVDDPVDEAERPLARRLALGAKAVVRLLQEGVLEEDQRTRQAFKACLVPLFATTDLWPYLLQVDREHSRRWLLDVIKEVLTDQVEPENIGAAAAALCLVQAEARQAGDIRTSLLATTMPYRAAVFKAINTMLPSHEDGTALTPWGVGIILESLTSETWFDLGLAGTHNAYAALERYNLRLSPQMFHLSDSAIEVIEAMIKSYRFGDQPSFDEEVRHGIVSVSSYPPPKVLTASTWSRELVDELAQVGGFVSLSAAIVRASSMGLAGSNWLDNEWPDACSAVPLLPSRVRAHLAKDMESASPDEADTPHWSVNLKAPGQLETFSLSLSSQDADWEAFADDYPGIALHLLVDNSRFRHVDSRLLLKNEALGRLVLKILHEQPSLALQSAAGWERLLNEMPYLADELRKVLLQAAADPGDGATSYYDDIQPIRPRLPEEAILLPHVASPLIHLALRSHSQRSLFAKDRVAKGSYLTQAVEQVRSCFSDIDALRSVAACNAQLPIVRASAQLLYLLFAKDRADISIDQLQTLAGWYNKSSPPWFLPAIGLVVNDAVEANRSEIKAAFSQVLQESRTDYMSRMQLDTLLERWREITRTPVTASPKVIWA